MGRVRRVLRFLAVTAVVLCIVFAVAWVFRVPLFGSWIEDTVTTALSDALGGAYAIDEVDGSFLSDLELHGLRTTEAPDDGPLLDLGAKRVHVTYSLWSLLTGDGLAAIERIDVQDARVDLDPQRPTRASSEDDGSGDGEFLPVALSAEIPALDLTGGVVRMATDGGFVTASGVRVTAAGDELELVVAGVTLPDGEPVPGSLEARVERAADALTWTSASTLGGLRVPLARLQRSGDGDVRIEMLGGAVDVRGSGGQLALDGDFDVAELPAWARPYLPDWPTRGRLTLTASRDDRGAPTRFRAEADDLVWRGERVGTLRAEGTWDGADTITVRDAALASSIATATVSDAIIDPRLPYLLRRARQVDVDVPRVRALFPGAERDVRLRLRAGSETPDAFVIRELRLEDDGLSIRATGTAALPDAPEDWRETALSGSFEATISDVAPLAIPWSGTVTLSGTLGGTAEQPTGTFTLEGTDLRVADAPVDTLSARGEVVWPDLRVETLSAVGAHATLDAKGTIDLDDDVMVADGFRLGVPDVSLIAGPDVTGSAALTGRLQRVRGTLTAAARLTSTNLLVGGEVLNISGNVTHADQSMELALRGTGPRSNGRLVATIDPAAGRARIVTADVRAHGLHVAAGPWTVTWDAEEVRLGRLEAWANGRQVVIAGSLRPGDQTGALDTLAFASSGLGAALQAPLRFRWQDDRLTFDPLSARIDDFDVTADLWVDLAEESATVESLRLDNASLHAHLLAPLVLRNGPWVGVGPLDAMVDDVRVRAFGNVDFVNSVARLRSLRVDANDTTATLRSPVFVWFKNDVRTRGLDVDVLGGRVQGKLAFQNKRISADLFLKGLKLGEVQAGAPGTLDARLIVENRSLVLDGRLSDLDWKKYGGSLTFRASQSTRGPVWVERVTLKGSRGSRFDGTAVLPWRLESTGLIHQPFVEPQLVLRGRLVGLDRLGEALGGALTLRAQGDASALAVDLRLSDALSTGPVETVVGSMLLTHAETLAQVGLEDEERVRLEGAAHLAYGFDWSDPPADVVSRIRDAALSAGVDAEVRDWAWLVRDADFVSRLEGKTALHARVDGTLGAPGIDAHLELDGVTLEPKANVNSFQDVNARLTWRGDAIRIERFEGLMGHAPVSLGGSLVFPEDGGYPVFDVGVRAQNALVIRSPYVRVRADVDARLTGAFDQLEASGNAKVTDLLYREPLNLGDASGPGHSDAEVLLFAIETWPFDRMAFDLDIEADRSLRIRNNLLRVDLSADLHLGGTGALPRPRGRIEFDNADVFLPLTRLRRGRGAVVFPSDEPFRPRLQFAGEARSRGYDIRVNLSGTLPDVDFLVFTEPYLDPDEAVLLVATGSTAAELAGTGLATTAARAVVEVFGGGLFSSGGSRGEPGDLGFMDRFYFVSEDGTTYRGRQIMGAETELTDRLFLRLEQDHSEQTNVGLIWRFRFR